MTLLAALVVAVVFASSVRLLLGRDLVRMAIGISLLSNAVNLFVIFCGLSRGVAPIHPIGPARASDPVVQALTLTAIVISGGVTLLVLGLLYRVAIAEQTLDARTLEQSEVRDQSRFEREARW